MRSQLLKLHPKTPQKVEVTEFTDSSITYEWEKVEGATLYRLYFEDLDNPIESTSTKYKRDELEQMSDYACSISAVNGNLEGDKSEKVQQRTRISAPKINEYHLNETYMTGTTISADTVIHAPIYKLDGTYVANGSVSNGNVRLYLKGNSKIIESESYFVYVLDGQLNQPGTIQSMPTEITILPPKAEETN